MNATECSHGGLTRRSFLKTTGVVATASAVGVSATPALHAFAAEYDQGQVETAEERIFDVVCRPNCFAYCHLNVHVRDGNLVKTSMGQYPDACMNRACLRGLSHVQRTYDPERIKYPLRRSGERGGDEWERVSWDDAISEVAQRFAEVQKQYGQQALAFLTITGNEGVLHGNVPGLSVILQNVLNATNIWSSVDGALTYGVNRVAGDFGRWVSNEPKDMVNAKTVIVWGNNITDAHLQEWHFLNEAMEGGAKLIVIDPTFTHVAEKADRWVPIRPATDAALTLGMMYVVLEENAQDETFLKEHTVAPFLVRSDNGKFVRMSDLGVAPTEGPVNPLTRKPTVIDPAVVWDAAADAPGSADEVADPALSGTRTINDIPCRTAFDLLKEEVMKYPPETVAKITEVPADVVVELAHVCMDGPVYHRVGFGPQAYDNGAHAAHAGMTLCGLLGNLGKPGASYGANWNICPGLNKMVAVPSTGLGTGAKISTLALREVVRTDSYKGQDYPIRALFVYSGNPLCTAVNSNELRQDVFDKMDYIVTVDTMMTDTARYSDMVLPCAHWFEYDDVIPCGSSHYMQYSKKAIEPLFESKTDADIIRLIADKMGVGEHVAITDEEFLAKALTSDYNTKFGISLEALKEKQAIRYLPDPFIAWEGGQFLTPSKRLEFYLEDPKPDLDNGQQIDVERERLPRFFPPGEAWPENPLYEKYPFVLMSERPRFRVHSQWYNTKLLRELDPEPTVKINPVDAEARSIGDGDDVECYNDRGHCVVKAVLSDGVRPGTLVYPKNWQAHQHKAGFWSELASSSYDPAAINQSFMDNLCDIRIWNGGE